MPKKVRTPAILTTNILLAAKDFFSQQNTVTKHKLFLLYLFCTCFIHIHNAGNPRR